MATFSATHHSIALVLKGGLRFLLPASNDIFRHFAFIYLFYWCFNLLHRNKRMLWGMCLCSAGGGTPNISQSVSPLIRCRIFDF